MLKETKCFFFSLFKRLRTLKDNYFMLYLYIVEDMVIVMSKRIYITLFCVLTLSLVLLGFSFARESGTNDVVGLKELTNDDYRVIYSDSQNISIDDSIEFDVGIINKSDVVRSYSLILSEVNNIKYDEVYYSVNDMQEQPLIDGMIYLGEISPYGQDGDYQKYNIKLINKSDEKLEFYLDTKNNSEVNLARMLERNSQVYKDENNNLHYYGKNVDNYIKYNEELYRIVGVFDGKIQIISEANSLGNYNNYLGSYLSVENFLGSYDKEEILNKDNAYKYEGWLLLDKEYWLSDQNGNDAYYANTESGINTINRNTNLYLRYVYDILDGIYIGGDGTINNPYEVSYGS